MIALDLRAALDPAVLFEQAFGVRPLDWQYEYLRATGNVALNKGRQVGGSLSAAALCIHVTRYRSNVNAIVVSPSQKQSTEVIRKARAGIQRLGLRLIEDSASVLRLANGSRVVSLPGSSKSVRGWTAELLVLDESAYLAEETILAARALVATGGRTVLQSTPAAPDGTFHRVISGEDDEWLRLTVRSDEVPTITAEWLEAQRREMPPEEFEREFLAVFGAASGRLFNLSYIEEHVLVDDPEGDYPDAA